MKYRVSFTLNANNTLARIEPSQRIQIVKWLEKHVENSEDPRRTGKLLKGDLAGLWRYRVGNYRLICDIQDDILLVLVVEIGHRKNVYN